MTRRSFGIGFLFLLLALLGYFGWLQMSVRMGGSPASLRGADRTEEEWIVREIVTDVSSMARGNSASGDLDSPLPVLPYPWAPEAYADLSQSFSPARAPAAPPDRELIGRLLRTTTIELVDEDFRLSALLSADPGSSSLHEEAALLLSVLALRESAGEFRDLRHAFSRITAHLAMASIPSEVGRVARAVLLTLAGRERDADPGISALESVAWRRILRMRLTDDWRLLEELEAATALEKLEWFRALTRTIDTATAMERYEAAFPDDELGLDWYRVAIAGYEGPSDGGYFRSELLDLELSEIREVRKRYGEAVRAVDLALNDPPRGFFGAPGEPPWVAGWNYWAGYYQRHLCEHLVTADTYFRMDLGLPDAAHSYAANADAHLARMALHPFVQMRRTARRGAQVEDIDGFGAVVRVTTRHPELVNSTNWYFAAWTTAQMALRQGMPRASGWFSPGLIAESAFDSRSRLVALGREKSPGDIAALMALAPNDDDAWRLFLELPRADPLPTEELIELMGPRREYDLVALGSAEAYAEMNAVDPAPFLERKCEIDRTACIHLGDLLVERSEDEKAVQAFRRAFDEASDRVHVSNHMRWLVGYYRTHRNTREAMIVARNVASTGSSRGFTTLAWLLEDMGELDQAEAVLEREAERYDTGASLAGFYFRLARVRGRSEYEEKLASAIEDSFPNGLVPYAESENDTPPRDGALINANSDRLRASGLLPGDIVVSLDGYRVRTFGQYQVVREFTDSPEMDFVVFRVNRYLPIETSVRDRRFEVDMIDYQPRFSIDSR